jgi:zinc protease
MTLRAIFAFLLFAALLGGPARAQTSDAARAAWGFDRSDLAPHPGVRFGVLPNGMRYALMRNAVPAGGLAVRLRFDAGASVEGPRELGFMHLIEHMIFHGTPNIPEGSLPLMLAHRGLKRLTDFNAFTGYEETVYRLDLQRADAPAREVALMLMREIAGNIPFTRSSVRGAKVKVREEIRARDAIEDRLTAAQNAFFAPRTVIARGPVAGSLASVGRADAAALRRLYDLYYRPSRATLVFVGDFDPAAVEAEIAARFGDWAARSGTAPEPPPPSVAPSRTSETRLFVDPAAPTAVTIAVAKPLGSAADAARPRDSAFLQHLAAEMLNRRLARVAAGSAPFASANLAVYDHFRTVRLARLEVAAKERDWRGALVAGARELARALQTGFSQEELDEQLTSSRRGLVAAPRTSAALADAIVDAVNRRIVFTAPGDTAAAAAYLARVRLADVNSAFRAIWAGEGKLTFVSHNRRFPNPEAAIAAALTEADFYSSP